MAYLDPQLMRTFRSKIRNPRHFHRVYGILRSYRHQDLKSPAGCYGMVDRLSRCLGVPVTREQRDHAAHWLMGCGVDPRNRSHRRRMWNRIHGGFF